MFPQRGQDQSLQIAIPSAQRIVVHKDFNLHLRQGKLALLVERFCIGKSGRIEFRRPFDASRKQHFRVFEPAKPGRGLGHEIEPVDVFGMLREKFQKRAFGDPGAVVAQAAAASFRRGWRSGRKKSKGDSASAKSVWASMADAMKHRVKTQAPCTSRSDHLR